MMMKKKMLHDVCSCARETDPVVFLLLVENNIAIVLDKLALSPVAVQSLGNGCLVKDVVLAQLGLQVLGRLNSVVEGHLREHVVALVRVANVVVQMVDDSAEGTINGAGSAALEVPLVVAEVGDSGVGVLEVSDAHDPGVDAQVGDAVVHEDGQGAEHGREVGQDRGHDGDAAVGVEDVLGLVGLKQRGYGLEVVDPMGGVVAREVDEEVQGPSEGEDKEEGAKGVEGSLGKDGLVVVVVVRVGLFLLLGSEALVGAGGGDEDDVLGHGSGSLVVLGVGHLPGLVGDKESRVEDPTKDGVDSLAVRESSMATLYFLKIFFVRAVALAKNSRFIRCLAEEFFSNVIIVFDLQI